MMRTAGRPFQISYTDAGRLRRTSAATMRNAEVKMGQLVAAGFENVNVTHYEGDGTTLRVWAVADGLGWKPLAERFDPFGPTIAGRAAWRPEVV